MNELLLPKRLHALQETFQVILKPITAKLSLAMSSGHHSGQASVESWALVWVFQELSSKFITIL